MGVPENTQLSIVIKESINKVFERIKTYALKPKIYYKIHRDLENLEYLIGYPDLAAGLQLSDEPKERAREFLLELSELFGFSTTQEFRLQLYWKHDLSSWMGTHCIFGMRAAAIEMEENCFVVHFDQEGHLVMVSSVYQPGMKMEPVEGEKSDDDLHKDLLGEDAAYYKLTNFSLQTLQRAGIREEILRPLQKKEFQNKGFRKKEDYWGAVQQQVEKELPVKTKQLLLEHAQKNLSSSANIHIERMWFPDWNYKQYQKRWRVKIATPEEDIIRIYNDKGEMEREYLRSVKAMPGKTVLGRTFQGFLEPRLELSEELGGRLRAIAEDDEKMTKRPLETVILRDLTSNHELEGRYASIKDDLNAVYWDFLNSQNLRIMKSDLKFSTWVDRMMAYYHIDLIQRYFRNELGLEVLDTYPHLNPVRVVLSEHRSQYMTQKMQIHLGKWRGTSFWTDAREARIIYHEFVHIVTDALARLSRADETDTDSARHFQILQAEAMDEGMADYFACSLAIKQGGRHAVFYPGMQVVAGRIIWEPPRYLERPCKEQIRNDKPLIDVPYNLQIAYTDDVKEDPETSKYEWAEQWGRYLWALRGYLGADIADILIAHSIFFLTRWATFGMGVLAIMLADHLLFEGSNERAILTMCEGCAAKDWELLE